MLRKRVRQDRSRIVATHGVSEVASNDQFAASLWVQVLVAFYMSRLRLHDHALASTLHPQSKLTSSQLKHSVS